MNSSELPRLDATTFQQPLRDLAEVLAQKLYREAPKLIAAAPFVAVDLFALLRQSMCTYDLVFYLNADERRKRDCCWRNAYSVVALPLIRNMIDCLFNITLILRDPPQRGIQFRASGFKKSLAALAEDERRYHDQQNWNDWIQRNRVTLDAGMRQSGLTVSDLANFQPWPTMGRYLARNSDESESSHQDFLRAFTYGPWREYSAMAHGAFEGLMLTSMFYISDSFPLDIKPKVDEAFPNVLNIHIPRAATLLLCTVTDVQAHFQFDDNGAQINERIHKMWDALMPTFEAKELYDQHYSELMKLRCI